MVQVFGVRPAPRSQKSKRPRLLQKFHELPISFFFQELNSWTSSPTWLSFRYRRSAVNRRLGYRKEDCPYSCGEVGGSLCYKARPATTGCCAFPHQNYEIPSIDYPDGCEDPGYACSKRRDQFFYCNTDTGAGCWTTIPEPCATTQCVDADNDGFYGYNTQTCPQGDDCKDGIFEINPGRDEICDDVLGQDENCDTFANCAATACYVLNPKGCDASCDYDQDGHWSDIPGCGGDDCADWEGGENVYTGFGAGSGGEAAGGGIFCGDALDNDCDDKVDCADDDCSTGPPCCAEPREPDTIFLYTGIFVKPAALIRVENANHRSSSTSKVMGSNLPMPRMVLISIWT